MDIKEFETKLDESYNEIKELLLKKNESYGFSVFQDDKVWNTIGLITRIGDKENRLKHLMKSQLSSKEPTAPFGESLQDTIKDILGYCLLLSVAQKL